MSEDSPRMKEMKNNISVGEETVRMARMLFPFPYDMEEELKEEALKMYPFMGFNIANKSEMGVYILRTLIIKGNFQAASVSYYSLVSIAIRENAKLQGISIIESAWDLRRRITPLGEIESSIE